MIYKWDTQWRSTLAWLKLQRSWAPAGHQVALHSQPRNSPGALCTNEAEVPYKANLREGHQYNQACD